MRDTDPSPKHIAWTTGRQGFRGNEATNTAARALISRVPPDNPPDQEEGYLGSEKLLTTVRLVSADIPARLKVWERPTNASS